MEIETSVSIPVKQPKLFQVLLSFPWSTRARGLFCSARVCEKVFKFCPLAEKRGRSLEGVRERGFNKRKRKVRSKKGCSFCFERSLGFMAPPYQKWRRRLSRVFAQDTTAKKLQRFESGSSSQTSAIFWRWCPALGKCPYIIEQFSISFLTYREKSVVSTCSTVIYNTLHKHSSSSCHCDDFLGGQQWRRHTHALACCSIARYQDREGRSLTV